MQIIENPEDIKIVDKAIFKYNFYKVELEVWWNSTVLLHLTEENPEGSKSLAEIRFYNSKEIDDGVYLNDLHLTFHDLDIIQKVITQFTPSINKFFNDDKRTTSDEW